MGCDIHAYVDYVRQDEEWIHHFGSFSIRRNYNLFGVLAGIRGGTPIIDPRGLPEHMSYTVLAKATLFILDDDKFNGEENTCTRSDVEKWNVKVFQNKYALHPDWHTFSWLTTKELGKVINETCRLSEMVAIHKAMQHLDEYFFSKFIFWFDN